MTQSKAGLWHRRDSQMTWNTLKINDEMHFWKLFQFWQNVLKVLLKRQTCACLNLNTWCMSTIFTVPESLTRHLLPYKNNNNRQKFPRNDDRRLFQTFREREIAREVFQMSGTFPEHHFLLFCHPLSLAATFTAFISVFCRKKWCGCPGRPTTRRCNAQECSYFHGWTP